MILIVAVGSALFIIVPYIVNLVIAARIKRFIKTNAAAKAWYDYIYYVFEFQTYLYRVLRFNAHTTVFCIFVVLTGGCYSALALVSSGIFGLGILSSGLTQFELRQLSNIRVIGTVILENVPQLMLQLIYASERGINISVGIAFFASVLSVIATLLSYLINRNGNEAKAVQYYLSIECQRSVNSAGKRDVDGILTVKPHVSHKNMTQISKDNKGKSVETIISNQNKLSTAEKASIMKNKGTLIKLTQFFSIII